MDDKTRRSDPHITAILAAISTVIYDFEKSCLPLFAQDWRNLYQHALFLIEIGELALGSCNRLHAIFYVM